MKQYNIETIRQLLDSYMDGDTTNEEEQTLHNYFAAAGENIPEEWRAYRALFAFEDAEREALDDVGRDAAQVEDVSAQSGAQIIEMRCHGAQRKWIMYAAAACAAAMLILSVRPFFTDKKAMPGTETPTDYAVIDGHRTTDATVVKDQAMEALNAISTNDEENFSALAE
jgi:hypothetical protein